MVETPDNGNQKELTEQIARILRHQGAIASENEIVSFSHHIAESERMRRLSTRRLQSPERFRPTDIITWIARAKRDGEQDEALWRGFLAGHFGRGSARPEQADSAGRLLCGFDDQPIWTWERVSAQLPSFEAWLRDHYAELSTLRFGNHRKYESQKLAALFRVVSSFAEWVHRRGGSPSEAFTVRGAATPEDRFDALYRQFASIARFGRTAAFDTLSLLGDTGVLDVRPGSCYLLGATGPMTGAVRLWGRRSAPELARLADEAARELGRGAELFEDTLCNWQK